ncbi:MAG: hypothetical protein NPINA01_08580 [Nitrospinaceae bacterium]|nr:MAG: hypothetical protein NPINA01_08580 [Nitrospinaceae bacterium]
MSKWIVSALLLFMATFPGTVSAEDDLFLSKKSDSAIKMLKFPLSLTVIESRPTKGHYYFYEGDLPRFDEGLEGTPDSVGNEFQAVLSDPKLIKKTLVATDPARITPSKQGEDIRGAVTKIRLKEIANIVSTDMILVFRREIRVSGPPHLPPSFFLSPGKFLTQPWQETYSVKIKTMGLVYLTKQNKIMIVPSNEKSKLFITKDEHITGEDLHDGWRQLAKEGLMDLATSAKKTILDKKFEVRRSSY